MQNSFKKTLSIMLTLLTLVSVFTCTPVKAEEKEKNMYAFGDVDLNGKISLKDASLVQRFVVGLNILKDEQLLLGNVDKSEELTLVDAYLIQKYIAGVQDEYPVNKYGYSIGDFVDVEELLNPDTDIDSEQETDTEIIDTTTDTVTDTEIIDTTTDTVTDTEEIDTTIDTVTDTEVIDTTIDTVTDTEEIDTTTDTETEIVTDTEESDTDPEIVTDSEETDTETDTDTYVEVLPIEQIQYNLNGDFERDDKTAVNWGAIYYYGPYTSSIEKGIGIDGSNCFKMTHGDTSKLSYMTNYLTGLEPAGEYKLTAKIKGENIQVGPHDNGAFLQVGAMLGGGIPISMGENGEISHYKESYGRGYQFDNYNNWLSGSFDWQETTVYFEADGRGRADVSCALQGSGTVYFDNIVIEKVNYQEEPNVNKVKVVGEHTGIIMYKEDVAKYTYDQLLSWVHDIDWAYEQMADLMGATPFRGDICYFLSTEEPYVCQYQAIGALNPIKWARGYMAAACRRFCENNVPSGVAYHELAHDFDNMYRPWTVELEATAEYKLLYVLLQKGGGVFNYQGYEHSDNVNDFPEYIRKNATYSYENTIAERDGIYRYEAMNYILYRATLAVGWDVVKAVFRDFNESYDMLYASSAAKFEYLMMCFQNKYNEMHPDATGFEIYDTFPEGEFEYIMELLKTKLNYVSYTDSQEIYAVQFVDATGKRLGFEYVPRGKSATPPTVPNSSEYGEFLGWDRSTEIVMSDMVVVAQYENLTFKSDLSFLTSSSTPTQGEFATFSVTDNLMSQTKYKFVVKRGSYLVAESDYSSDDTFRIMLTENGTYTYFAYVKTDEGLILQTPVQTFDVQPAVTIYYNGYTTPYIHYKIGDGDWTTVPGVPMKNQYDVSGYSHRFTIPVPNNEVIVTFCFNDGKNNWDSNGQRNYSQRAGVHGMHNGSYKNLQNFNFT